MEQKMAEPPVPASGEDQSSLPYASVPSRIWAAILDFIAVYLVFAITLAVVGTLQAGSHFFGMAASILAVVIPWLYFAGFESSAARATPGKKMARIVVTDAHGARISFARASARFLGKVPLLATLGLAMLTVYFDRQRRALDDLIAGTRVHDMEAVAPGGPRPLWKKAIGPVILVAVIGVMGKIAIDAKNDFEGRAVMSGVIVTGDTARSLVSKFHERSGRLPQSSAEAGLRSDSGSLGSWVSSVAVRDNGIVAITLIESRYWPNGGEITLVPTKTSDGKSLTWKCRSTLPPKTLPPTCRD